MTRFYWFLVRYFIAISSDDFFNDVVGKYAIAQEAVHEKQDTWSQHAAPFANLIAPEVDVFLCHVRVAIGQFGGDIHVVICDA